MPKHIDALPHQEVLDNIDRQIAVLRYQTQQLEYLRAALADEGTFARLGLAMTHTWQEVIDAYAEKIGTTTATPPLDTAASRGPTNFDKVALFFRARKNAWAPSAEIANATGIKLTVLRDVLYKTHKDQFDRKDNAKGRGLLFRVNEGDVSNV